MSAPPTNPPTNPPGPPPPLNPILYPPYGPGSPNTSALSLKQSIADGTVETCVHLITEGVKLLAPTLPYNVSQMETVHKLWELGDRHPQSSLTTSFKKAELMGIIQMVGKRHCTTGKKKKVQVYVWTGRAVPDVSMFPPSL